MELTYQIRKWEMNYPVVLTILRIVLGICLTIRGIYFLNNSVILEDIVARNSGLGFSDLSSIIAAVITWVHILGGTFIILGLFTPIVVWAQVPIVLGAIIFVNIRSGGPYSTTGDLLFSIFILVLLLLFAAGGSGQISMDNYIKKHLL